MKEMNLELLKALYSVHSPSMQEKKMRRFLKRYITDNVPSACIKQDENGNLLVTKGEAERYPCLCAHMDQVQDFHPKDFVCIEDHGVIFGYSPKTHKQCGLGADDKNGIFVALTCLQKYDALKCAFFVGEEIGCVGSSAADVSFFDDCIFCAQIDRRGNSDMVTKISWQDLCSDEFVADVNCTAWGYRISDGLSTDVAALRGNGVTAACVNLSCGYYEPHTDREFTVIEDLQKCYAFVCHLIKDCTGDYSFNSTERNTWKGRYDAASWEYDECLDACSDMLQNYPEMSWDEFNQLVCGNYQCLKEDDLKDIYKTALSFVQTVDE